VTNVTPQQARCTAVKQLHYVAGDNDRGSYIVGVGKDSSARPHHRNSVCSPEEHQSGGSSACLQWFYDKIDPDGKCVLVSDAVSGTCFPQANRANLYTLHGALVGGVKTPTDAGDANRAAPSKQGYNDWRTDYQGNEVAIDYNAPLVTTTMLTMLLPASFWDMGCTSAF